MFLAYHESSEKTRLAKSLRKFNIDASVQTSNGHEAIAALPGRVLYLFGEVGLTGKRDDVSRTLFRQMTHLSWVVTISPKLTGSIGACYESLKEASRNKEDDGGDGKKDKKSKSLRDDPHFKILMLELETQRSRGFGTHPKVEKLKDILIDHFAKCDDTSRVMVFSSYRAVVDEIVEELSRERPLIRASRFIGQGVDKQGNKGLPQKEQLEVSSCSVNAMTIVTLSTAHRKVQSG